MPALSSRRLLRSTPRGLFLAAPLVILASLSAAEPPQTQAFDEVTGTIPAPSMEFVHPMLRAELAHRSNPENKTALALLAEHGAVADQRLAEFANQYPEASEQATRAVMYVELYYPPEMTLKVVRGIDDEELLACWNELWKEGLPNGLELVRTMGHNACLSSEMRKRADRATDLETKGRFLEVFAGLQADGAALFQLRRLAQESLAALAEMEDIGYQPVQPVDEAEIARLQRMAAGEFSAEDAPRVAWENEGVPRQPRGAELPPGESVQ